MKVETSKTYLLIYCLVLSILLNYNCWTTFAILLNKMNCKFKELTKGAMSKTTNNLFPWEFFQQ
jgi:regulatory protein YycH of two-component signal transduction system YycFG